MPQPVLAIRALIASPSDLDEERLAIPEVIAVWNATHSRDKAVLIEPVKWESHSTPLQGDRPQSIINKQLVDNCDFVIAVFWTKLGSSTGVTSSGTVEEIMEFEKAGKPVLLYFSDRPIPPSKTDSKQLRALNVFKATRRSAGLYESYRDINEFREKLSRHINDVASEYLSRHTQTPIGATNSTVASLPLKPILLEGSFQYSKAEFSSSTLQRECTFNIYATNNQLTTVNRYEIHVEIPKPIVHSSNQTGRILHNPQSQAVSVFQFPPNQTDSLPPLLPGRKQLVARVSCLVAEFNAEKQDEVCKQKIQVTLYGDGFPPQVLELSLEKNPFDLMKIKYDQLEFEHLYTL